MNKWKGLITFLFKSIYHYCQSPSLKHAHKKIKQQTKINKNVGVSYSAGYFFVTGNSYNIQIMNIFLKENDKSKMRYFHSYVNNLKIVLAILWLYIIFIFFKITDQDHKDVFSGTFVSLWYLWGAAS